MKRRRGTPLDQLKRVVIDRTYLREQAKDAVRTFVAPLNGVYRAAVGSSDTPSPDGKKKDTLVPPARIYGD